MINTVIIQAGGIGSRMDYRTKNKPKCLLPYKGKTILENNLQYFNGKKIIIIVDYLSDLFIEYVRNILNRKDIIFINAKEKSTTSGLKDAFNHLTDYEPFILMWSDLFLEDYIDDSFHSDVTIGITSDFKCRWKFKNGELKKETTNEMGVMGIFLFKNKSVLLELDESKSFVGGNLKELDKKYFDKKEYKNVVELGELETYDNLLKKTSNCRFFNKIEYVNDTVIKTCVDKNYSNLIKDEISWYSELKDKVDFIPKLLNENPFTIEKLNGKHLYDIETSVQEKTKILNLIYNNLNFLHKIKNVAPVKEDIKEIYVNKTFDRVNSVSSVIPFFKRDTIKINGKLNINPFTEKNIEYFKTQLEKITVPMYNIIHGDVTFSNILLVDSKCYFIDPRGYFGNTKMYGDKNYDWAKLYYSVNGNYDSINSKKFTVDINNNEVILNIKSNGFEDLSNDVVDASGMNKNEMNLLHALIWLSLTGYVKEDIDAIYYSFFKGIELWNLTLN